MGVEIMIISLCKLISNAIFLICKIKKLSRSMLKSLYWTLLNFYLYFEEPWKGSVPEVYHKRTTDGSDLEVIDPNGSTLSYATHLPNMPI